MAANLRLAGVTQLSIDGTFYDLVGDTEVRVSDRSRTTLVGADRVHGYSEQVVAGMISCTLRDNGNRSAKSFQAMTNSTVQVFFASGKVVTGQGMWNTEAVSINPSEATFKVSFEGASVSEDLATNV